MALGLFAHVPQNVLFCRPVTSSICQGLARCRTVTAGFFGGQKEFAGLCLALTHLKFWAEQAAHNAQWLGIQAWSCSPFPSLCPRECLCPCSALDTSVLRLPSCNELSLLHRKLYFAQSHKPPYHGRVCVAPPGCLLSSSPDGPTKGILYVPSEKGKADGYLFSHILLLTGLESQLGCCLLLCNHSFFCI